MFALGMEARLRVGRVVDDLKFALLVVISVAPVQDPGGVPLLVPELPVVAHPRVVAEPVAVGAALAVDLEGDFLWLGVVLLQQRIIRL